MPGHLQAGDQGLKVKLPGGAAVADFVVGARAEFAAEFQSMLPALPRQGIQNLPVQDGSLSHRDTARCR